MAQPTQPGQKPQTPPGQDPTRTPPGQVPGSNPGHGGTPPGQEKEKPGQDLPQDPQPQPKQSQQQAQAKPRLMKDCQQPKRPFDFKKDYASLPRFAADFGRAPKQMSTKRAAQQEGRAAR